MEEEQTVEQLKAKFEHVKQRRMDGSKKRWDAFHAARGEVVESHVGGSGATKDLVVHDRVQTQDINPMDAIAQEAQTMLQFTAVLHDVPPTLALRVLRTMVGVLARVVDGGNKHAVEDPSTNDLNKVEEAMMADNTADLVTPTHENPPL